MHFKNRKQKVEFLRSLLEGRASINDLQQLPPMGMVIEEGGEYLLNDGRRLSKDEFTAYASKWQNAPKGTIYGMIII